MPFSRGSQLRSDPCQGVSGGVFRAQNPHFSPTRFHEDPFLSCVDHEAQFQAEATLSGKGEYQYRPTVKARHIRGFWALSHENPVKDGHIIN